jgi:hypothetical protein
MDEQINGMVSEDIQFAEIIIQSEGEIGHRPGQPFLGKSIKRVLDLIPVQCRQMYMLILDNIVFVVEMPNSVKRVTVNEDQNNEEGKKNEYVFSPQRERPLKVKIKSVGFVYHVVSSDLKPYQ